VDDSAEGRARLRAVVADIDRGMSRLASPATPEWTDGLISSWAELVRLLDLAPVPEVRECPVCKRLGMRAATICGFCWTKLPPLGLEDAAPRT
jgi:hypothetical protein